LTKELDTIVKSISLNDKNAPIKFIPINRINTIIAIAPNPGAFIEVEKWITKLDVPAKITAGSVDNYVYRVKFQQAQLIGGAIMQLYGGNSGYGGYGGGFGGFGGSYGGGGFGGLGGGGGIGTGGGNFGSGGAGGYGGGGGFGANSFGTGGGGYGANNGFGGNGYGNAGGGYGATGATGFGDRTPNGVASGTAAGTPGTATGGDLTGQYLNNGGMGGNGNLPRIIPNPLDNTLLIQATPQQYEGILKLLKQLDVPPRQVLIEAKIYEVDLNDQFSSGVSAYLESQNSTASGTTTLSTNKLLGSLVGDTTSLTAGALVGKTRQLLAFVQLQEDHQKAKTISAPSIIATDSIAASINVGDEVPTLSSQAVTGVQVSGSSAFANTINNVQTGTTLNILARVNPSGIVTMVINQNVSAPIPAPAGAGSIASPSFSQRTVSTQVTVNDGDTIAIAGIINESSTLSTSGIPILEKLPYVGALFGSHSISKMRTELIVFITPRVIYDMNEVNEASDELKSRLKKLRKIVTE
jgi:general secretion pathway protein D